VTTLSQDPRRSEAEAWLFALRGISPDQIQPASADASFRRYFRIHDAAPSGGSLILMDAPPDKEPLDAFLHVADLLQAAGLHVPQRFECDKTRGFLLLEDLGQTDYLSVLNEETAPLLYLDAIKALVTMQSWGLAQAQTLGLPAYDEQKLKAEMQLFPQWYVAKHKHHALTDDENAMLEQAFDVLSRRARSSPQVIVHRDYHSRNLMKVDDRNPGVIDFQDAVVGPLTYDLVSLLRDAYKPWEEAQQLDWAIAYWQSARSEGLPVQGDFSDFWEDFEWVGLQRHLKVLGIFARLSHRDGKHGYLKDIPVVLRDAQRVARRYAPFHKLAKLLDRLEARQA